MALPIMATTLGGMIISSLTVFFATRIPVIMATLGLSAVVYKSLDVFVDQMISAIQGTMTGGDITFGGQTINGLAILGAAGLWDAVNIILSGYVTAAAVKAAKVSIQAIKK